MQLHKDPTFEAAQRMEIEQKKCSICMQSIALIHTKKNICASGKQWPFCKYDRKNGFKIRDC